MCISADGRLALSGSADATLRVWNIATGNCMKQFEASGLITSVSLSHDGKWALSGGTDKNARVWEVDSAKCIGLLEGHTDRINSVCLSPDCRWALTASDDKTIRVWELDWEFEPVEPLEWDERLGPHLLQFLFCQMPYAAQLPKQGSANESEITAALTRQGVPVWTEQDFETLLCDLSFAGFGCVRGNNIRRELEKMTREWDKLIVSEL